MLWGGRKIVKQIICNGSIQFITKIITTMRKLLMAVLLLGAVACNNPEEKATTTQGDTSAGYQDEHTLNTPPGGTSPDTSGATRMDSAHLDTMHN